MIFEIFLLNHNFETQLQLLKEMNCDFCTGFSPPDSAQEFEQLSLHVNRYTS